jgi:FlaA1/EpsC-like NDP-sugar epimerase
VEFFTRRRFVVQGAIDSAAWLVALSAAVVLRFEFDLSRVEPWAVAAMWAVASAAQLLIGRLFGLYVHRWRYGTFEEVMATVRTAALVTLVISVVTMLPTGDHVVPLSTTLMSGFIALACMSAARFVWRMLLERWTRAHDDGRETTLVVGAGQGGLQIVTSMLQAGPYHPVAVLDDNPDLRNLRLKGVPVMGDTDAMEDVVRRTGATTLVIAIPSASGQLLRSLSDRATALGMKVLTLPPVAELFGVGVDLDDIRPLTEADLLGRRELNLDIETVAGYLTGKRVLVTGAGGSIGSELCRQIHRFAPASLVMLDRDESALQGVQISIEGRGLLDSRNLVVCCIRDAERLEEVFAEHEPQVVFHAAALKHLPLLEMHPDEGWKTNVRGTQNLLELSGKFAVERFVNISTDKAADPSSVLGSTKRVAEQLTATAGRELDGTYLSVRFGNVLGSRGSVVPLFRAQIEQGGPVTVTHPDVTRFFMTIPEACQLVIQAGALDQDGHVLVLDMGEPVRIAEIAERLVAESQRNIEIVYTGLRPGEKMHEQLFAELEDSVDAGHPLIRCVDVPPIDITDAEMQRSMARAEVVDLRGTATSGRAETDGRAETSRSS